MTGFKIFRFVLAVFASAAVAALSGCSTMAGLGNDIQSAGQGIQNTAQDAMR